MEQDRILIAEDDGDINALLAKILTKEGYRVTQAYSGTEASLRVSQERYDLLLLDLMLPGMTGEELIAQLRKTQTMPIIVISAKTAQEDKVETLTMGADDFITKPFDLQEVLARVKAQLRRYKKFAPASEQERELRHKGLVLNRETVQVTLNGVPVPLTAREFFILALLMEYPTKVFTRANLFEHVWNDTYMGDDNTVNVHISNIRSKLSKVDDGEYIKTVWGIGFKMAD